MKSKFNIFVITLLIFYGSLYGQNFNDALRLAQPSLGVSARALGMGNAFISVGGDYSSTFYNPAGLGLIKQSELMGGLDYNSFDNKSTFFNSNSKFSVSNTTLNQFGFAFPFTVVRGSLVASFGYNKIIDFNSSVKFKGFNSNNNSFIQSLTSQNNDLAYQLGLSYPLYDGGGTYLKDTTRISGLLNQSGSIIDEGSIDSWSFAGAVEIAKNVFAGVTFNILSGSYQSTRDYYEDDINNRYNSSFQLDPQDSRTAGFNSFYFNDAINWDLTGWDMKLGFLYKTNKNVTIGMGIKFPTFYTVKELYTVYGESSFANASFSIDPSYRDEIEYDITTPYEFSGGISGKVAGLTLAADFNFMDYTQMKFDGGLQPAITSENNKQIKEVFKSVFNYSAGMEYTLPVFELTLRAGYILQKSPYIDDTQGFDKKFYTFGLGFKPSRNVAFDLAVLRGSWNDFIDNYGAGISRVNQNIDKNKFLLTVRYLY